ncbi:MAG: ribonuclease H [Candidatus Harrisonbacteria bacterium CG10_big_fil_rev_8_21_14_0_10_38_8]|uniref:Ribonuclease H n=1 Tax=Candidatus Harrisonbacteria bacterium CG10_big_fil_rev_8_21_14_0_10_38_8 TaxID=1974582 RepID=A0A2M6WK57_9BACT|nr:MAG: ribonuclease H [Candidatus Harrisonbacteria bacterium CG10_big_fil_rev_8_21_14_0_10_38_8]
MNKLEIYTDGGSRGNPGPAGIGAVVGDKNYSEFIGEATNNVAEYKAILLALTKAKQLLGKTKAKQTEVEVKADSQLAIRQLSGEYKIENETLQPLFLKIWNLRLDFKKVTFTHIPREENKQADKLANEAMDRG